MSNEWKDYDNDIRESIKDICRCEEVCPNEDCLRIETEPCVVKCLLDKCEIAQAQSKTFKSELIAWESAYDSLGDELVSMRKRVAEWRQKWHDLKHVEMKGLEEKYAELVEKARVLVDEYPDDGGWFCPHCGPTDCIFEGGCTTCGYPIERNEERASLVKNLENSLPQQEKEEGK